MMLLSGYSPLEIDSLLYFGDVGNAVYLQVNFIITWRALNTVSPIFSNLSQQMIIDSVFGNVGRLRKH